jgi:hypothetical protein
MKWLMSAAAVAALLVAGSAQAGDVEWKPVDTKRFVVQPTKKAAELTAKTIQLAGGTAANSIENNGYVKTINNLFGWKKTEPRFQTGPSALPSPNLYKSTQYMNYNTPVMPTVQYRH